MSRNSVIRAVVVFVVGFALNVVWENMHSALYLSYRGGMITESILLRAAFWDAIIILVICLPIIIFPFLAGRTWLVTVAGLVVAAVIELYALHTGRWVYAAAMPIVPLLGIGLTPFLQLAVTGYVSYKVAVNERLFGHFNHE